jgi:hypothetical protein
LNYKGEDFLFNLLKDPQEKYDLKTKHPKHYQDLKSLFREILATLPEPKTNRSQLK